MASEESDKRTIQVRQFIDGEQLREDIGFSLAGLSDAMVQQASLFVHYSGLAAKASRQVNDLKLAVEAAESKVYRGFRDTAVTKGEKTTEAQLERQVALHETVRKLKLALNEARQIEDVAKAAVEAFRHRRDMLVQQGAFSREEMKGEVFTARRNEEDVRNKETQDRVLRRITGE